jgi:hypothetical protein
MPNYKPIRSKRYEHLRSVGFLHGEAQVLSKVPEKTPYLRAMKQDRKILFGKAIQRTYTQAQYKTMIEKQYKLKGWSHVETQGNRKVYKMCAAAYYRMLREYEDRYKDEKGSQAFKSPWIKKQKVFQDFSRKFDKAFDEKQFHD